MCHDAVETKVAFVAESGSSDGPFATAGVNAAPAALGAPVNAAANGGESHEIVVTMFMDESVLYKSAAAAADEFANAAADGDVAVIVAGAYEFEVVGVTAAPPPTAAAPPHFKQLDGVGRGGGKASKAAKATNGGGGLLQQHAKGRKPATKGGASSAYVVSPKSQKKGTPTARARALLRGQPQQKQQQQQQQRPQARANTLGLSNYTLVVVASCFGSIVGVLVTSTVCKHRRTADVRSLEQAPTERTALLGIS